MRTRNKGKLPKKKELDHAERELFLNAFYQNEFSTVEKYIQTRPPASSKKVAIAPKFLSEDAAPLDEEEAQLFLDTIAGITPSVSLTKEQLEKKSPPTKIAKKKTSIDAKLDLHGLHAEQAVAYLLRFLEAERARNSKTVLVVHGKGQGILKKAVWSIIETHPYVDDFQVAPGKYGGQGAILVRICRRAQRR